MVVQTRTMENHQQESLTNSSNSLETQFATLMNTVTNLSNAIVAIQNRLDNGEESSQRREVLGGPTVGGGQTAQNHGQVGQYGRLTKIEFPKFDGEDVIGWLYRVNKFFEMDQIVNDFQKITLVSMHMFGKALNWHKQFVKRHGENVAWVEYEAQVKQRFESVFEDPIAQLKNLKQTTNVQVYQESFEALLNKVDLPESYTISLFIGGLKEEIAHAVRMFKPASLIDVFCLSKLQEAALSVNKNRSAPLLATPKTNVMGVIVIGMWVMVLEVTNLCQ